MFGLGFAIRKISNWVIDQTVEDEDAKKRYKNAARIASLGISVLTLDVGSLVEGGIDAASVIADHSADAITSSASYAFSSADVVSSSVTCCSTDVISVPVEVIAAPTDVVDPFPDVTGSSVDFNYDESSGIGAPAGTGTAPAGWGTTTSDTPVEQKVEPVEQKVESSRVSSGTETKDLYYVDVNNDGYKNAEDYKNRTNKQERQSDGTWHAKG